MAGSYSESCTTLRSYERGVARVGKLGSNRNLDVVGMRCCWMICDGSCPTNYLFAELGRWRLGVVLIARGESFSLSLYLSKRGSNEGEG